MTVREISRVFMLNLMFIKHVIFISACHVQPNLGHFKQGFEETNDET